MSLNSERATASVSAVEPGTALLLRCTHALDETAVAPRVARVLIVGEERDAPLDHFVQRLGELARFGRRLQLAHHGGDQLRARLPRGGPR